MRPGAGAEQAGLGYHGRIAYALMPGFFMRSLHLATARSIAAALAAVLLLATACAPAALDVSAAPAESRATQPRHFMAAAANPLAADVGRDILARGGNAVDAAIAMQMVLNLVEPQSSGIGGGAFLLYYDAKTKTVTAYDGRETAPADATSDMFLTPEGTPKDFFAAAVGGGAVGVPGLLAMLEMAHRDHGKIPWRDLFAPAIRMAEEGFAVSPRLHGLIAGDEHLRTFPSTAAYFFHGDGSPLAVGETAKNPALAESLRAVAAGGADAFYKGRLAKDIVAAVRGVSVNPGRLQDADFAAYRAKRREAVCRPYREWRVCGTPPPSSGGTTVLEALGLLEPFGLAALEPESALSLHLMAEASRLAFADRNRYLADPDFVLAPVDLLLDRGYLARRSRLISPTWAAPSVLPGTLAAAGAPQKEAAADWPASSTTHMSVVDADGNAVAFTSSIEAEFGSRLMVDGFLLNNELTDFSFQPVVDGRPAANRPEPGKRPLSSMAPTLVFDREGRFVLSAGSPGGQNIIDYLLKTLVAVLDWNLGVQQAIDLPNFAAKTGTLEIEKGTLLEPLKDALEAMGHAVKVEEMTSGIQAIEATPSGLAGAGDARREGVARGD